MSGWEGRGDKATEVGEAESGEGGQGCSMKIGELGETR